MHIASVHAHEWLNCIFAAEWQDIAFKSQTGHPLSNAITGKGGPLYARYYFPLKKIC